MAVAERPTSYSQSLERGLAILSAFKPARPLLGISELARTLALNRSTAHRYVGTLTALGYLQQDRASRKYRLGPRVLDLGFSAINSMELPELARPHLQHLSDDTGHTVNMAILDGTEIVYVERVPELGRGPERDRPQPPRRLAPARVLHVDGQGAARVPPPTTSRDATLDRIELVQPRPEHGHEAVRARAGARARARARASPSTTRSSRTGCARSPCPCASRSGEVEAAINLAVHRTMVSMDDLIGAARPCARADRGRDLRACRLPRRGGRVTSVASTETAPRDRVRLGGLTQLVAFTVSIAVGAPGLGARLAHRPDLASTTSRR